jgi:hypothetical protein
MKRLANLGSSLHLEIGAERLPPDFPNSTQVPMFTEGDRVYWQCLEDAVESVDIGIFTPMQGI